jgi:hypothetical protein
MARRFSVTAIACLMTAAATNPAGGLEYNFEFTGNRNPCEDLGYRERVDFFFPGYFTFFCGGMTGVVFFKVAIWSRR